jgi:hypothetical protein
MSLTDMNEDHQVVLEQDARHYVGFEKAVLKVGADVFNRRIGHGGPTAKRLALEGARSAMRRHARMLKSEAEATRDAESTDFDIGPATQGMRADAATRALQVQGLAQAATRRLQATGINDPTEDDYSRAIREVLNVSLVNFEGENGITVDNSNPQVAANMRERESNDGTIWELTDMADPRQQQLADEATAAAAGSNFAKRRGR